MEALVRKADASSHSYPDQYAGLGLPAARLPDLAGAASVAAQNAADLANADRTPGIFTDGFVAARYCSANIVVLRRYRNFGSSAYDQLQPCVDTVVASHPLSAGRPCERRDPSPLALKGKKASAPASKRESARYGSLR